MPVSPVPRRLDHLIYGVPDLDRGMDDMERLLGVRPAVGGRHEAFGTRNALLALGEDHYLELIAADRGADNPPVPRILGLDRLAEAGLISWVARSTDIESDAREARRRGASLGNVLSGSRTKPDGTRVTWTCTDPAAVQVPGILPFLIDWGATASPARSAPAGCVLRRLRAEHPRADEARAALDRLGLDLEVTAGRVPQLIALLETPQGQVELR